MANSTSTIQRYIAHLATQLGATLTWQNGVCALYDNEHLQAAVIELPEHSDNVIFHCRLGTLQPGPEHLQRLLALNFDTASLRGCWLALDQGDVRLCTQRELSRLDEESFSSLVGGFVVQARETRSSLSRILS
ncbi:type III secretion system chaperone [Pseudomonas vanderleydeniana]|uniref:Type III secretion system chaperone n=1 Tax=Pseudomonas vanderleydeniana TaxID=2745495 RepID=A0A9E6PQY0_9PSED|nr:type III secretion system chaperone [Pseudomonas vanderleydeniana]QXI31254.1 type III secretion system chaperone [Pseudomonas vanderleydeniana]